MAKSTAVVNKLRRIPNISIFFEKFVAFKSWINCLKEAEFDFFFFDSEL